MHARNGRHIRIRTPPATPPFLELRPERLNVEAGKMIRSPSSPPLGLREAENTSVPHGNAIVEAVVPHKYNGVTKG